MLIVWCQWLLFRLRLSAQSPATHTTSLHSRSVELNSMCCSLRISLEMMAETGSQELHSSPTKTRSSSAFFCNHKTLQDHEKHRRSDPMPPITQMLLPSPTQPIPQKDCNVHLWIANKICTMIIYLISILVRIFLMPVFRITSDHAILPIISTASFWFPNAPHVLQQQHSSNCLTKDITVFQVISRTWSGQTFLNLSSQSSRARKIKQRLRVNSCIQRKPSTQSPMSHGCLPGRK
jgi:hypothetical protein